MISVKKILFPTDFSGGADAALAWAAKLANSFEAELIMFHAVVLHGDDVGEEVYSRFPDLDQVSEALLEHADSRLGKSASGLGDLKIRQMVRRGLSASDEIIRFAQDEAVDLIVMGTHGHKGLRHLILGSVTERVVRYADCPVMAVRLPGTPPHETVKLNRIVLPVDFSEFNRLTARYAHALAEIFSAEIEAVHVFEQTVHPSFYAIGVQSIFEVDTDLKGRAEKAVEDFMRDAGVDMQFKCTLVEGRSAEEIAKVAARNTGSIVIIGSHGSGGLERLIMGSTTEKLLRLAECPVLVVKPDERDFVK